jgi:hypothetical protein
MGYVKGRNKKNKTTREKEGEFMAEVRPWRCFTLDYWYVKRERKATAD